MQTLQQLTSDSQLVAANSAFLAFAPRRDKTCVALPLFVYDTPRDCS